jgi:phosphohistidine phosphatase
MKTIFLLRHAKSSWKHPELSDPDRPLNKRGKRQAPEMGTRIHTENLTPDQLTGQTRMQNGGGGGPKLRL